MSATTKTYTVTGMTCGHCSNAVTEEVSAIAGVTKVDVNLDNGTVTVTGTNFTDEQVKSAVDEAGYEVV